MKTGWSSATGRILALSAFAVAVAASPVAAQQSSTDCRCVDRDGDQIERCTCFRMPRVEGLLRGLSFADTRPRLGISVSTSQGAELDAQGARVTQVLEDGPADDAGIREDDVITRIDGQSLFDPLPGDAEDDFDLDESIPVQRLLAIARQLEPGQEAEIEYLRDGEARSTSVEAEDLSESWLSPRKITRRFSPLYSFERDTGNHTSSGLSVEIQPGQRSAIFAIAASAK